ncbi:MAG TPA: HlyD family efflux transporter periplasmic adaptor subunit [Ruminococcus sp.]|nr:HlyD family efflux transporter periplasmic adaptor subunit [Ruminococcus sp.]
MRFTKSEGSLMVKILRNTVLVLFLVIFISIVYNFRNRESDTVSALIAEATASKEFKGVFIRDETPIPCSANGVLSYNVSDGGKIGKGTVVAQVYPNEEQITVNRNIEKLTKELEILRKIQNPGTQESVQPAALSESIKENYRSLILNRDLGDHGSVENVAETMLVQLSTYQIITNEVENFNQEISDLESELAELKKQPRQVIESIVSPKSAYFVSYCDGYEGELSSKTLDKLTIARISEINDNRNANDYVVGKLVDGYCWYLAGVVDNSRKEYKVGNRVKIRLASSADVFDTEIYDIRDEGDPSQSIIILSCSQFSYDLVQHRAENIELIRGEYKGLKVPREAIRFRTSSGEEEETSGYEDTGETSEKGVYIRKGEQILFKKIDVIYEGSDYVLSKIYDEDDSYLALYDDILLEGDD